MFGDNCSNKLFWRSQIFFANSCTSALTFKSFSRSIEQFFLTEGQTILETKLKIPFSACIFASLIDALGLMLNYFWTKCKARVHGFDNYQCSASVNHIKIAHGTVRSYSSNKIRKTQNEHLNIVFQNLNSQLLWI